jgi:ComF family protein
VRNALHDLKYRRNLGLGASLALHLENLLQNHQWNINLVAPVPLGKERRKQRGYNQGALIAQPLALALQLPYNPQILIRTRETQSQVDLTLSERQSNLDGAFQANNKVATNKRILIIDDVSTSGSTLDACAKALKKAGADTVFGLTIARAVLDL